MADVKCLVVLFTFWRIAAVVNTEICYKQDADKAREMYCEHGCCGSTFNQDCCTDKNDNNRDGRGPGEIVGIMFSCLFGLAVVTGSIIGVRNFLNGNEFNNNKCCNCCNDWKYYFRSNTVNCESNNKDTVV